MKSMFGLMAIGRRAKPLFLPCGRWLACGLTAWPEAVRECLSGGSHRPVGCSALYDPENLKPKS